MTAPCPFCQRIDLGLYIERSAGVVWFEPLNPVTPGHMLFVPTIHATSAAADPQGAAQAMNAAARYVLGLGRSANIITSIGAPATQTVWHTHLHVVPRYDGDGLTLPWTGQQTATLPRGQHQHDGRADVLESRTPLLNPWEGVGVLALHSHTEDQPCDSRCSVYRRSADE